MRICHVVESAGGGSGQAVIDLARAGLAEGDDVTVVYAPNRAEPSFVRSLTAIDGVRIVETPMRYGISAYDLLDGWRLYHRLRRNGPFDVLHGHSSKAGALVRLTGLALRETLKVYTPHCFVSMDPDRSSVYLHVERMLSWLSDAIIVVSSFERDHAVRRIGIARNKVNFIANGVANDNPTERAAARSALGYRDDEFVLGFVGRLTDQKNPLRLLDAFAIARRGHPSLRLAIVGDGPMRSVTESRAARHRVAEDVRCFGHRPGRALMAGFDALICSSNYEGLPIVFLEALAAGVPIITTPVGGARECVVHGRTGFIAGGLASHHLAQAILQMMKLSDVERSHMSTNCRLHVDRFGGSLVAGATRNLYVHLMRSNGTIPRNKG